MSVVLTIGTVGAVLFIIAALILIWMQKCRPEKCCKAKDYMKMVGDHANAHKVYKAVKLAEEHGLELSVSDLEAHDLAGGDVDTLVQAAVIVYEKGMEVNLPSLGNLDLAGKDVVKVAESAGVESIYTFPSEEDGRGHYELAINKEMVLKYEVRLTLALHLNRFAINDGLLVISRRIDELVEKWFDKNNNINSHFTGEQILQVQEYLQTSGIERETPYELHNVDVVFL